MSKRKYGVLKAILSAVDTGSYDYGCLPYDYYLPADEYHNPPRPFALGAWKFYGEDAKAIIRRVYNLNPEIFCKRYPNFLISDFELDWSNGQYRPSNEHIDLLRQIMSSVLGVRYQEMEIEKRIRYCLASAESCGVTSLHGQIMWTDFQMLDGLEAARRIFSHCGAEATLDEIVAAIDTEQFDKSSKTHIGNDIYGKRHKFFADCIRTYIYQEGSNTQEDK